MYRGKKARGEREGKNQRGKGRGKNTGRKGKWGKEKETALIPRVGNYLVSNTNPQKFI